MEVRDGRIKGKGRKCAEGGTPSGHAQEDFRRSVGQTWKLQERRKVRDKEMQEEKEVHGRKIYRDVGKYAGGGTSSGHAQEENFGRESAGQNNWEVREIEESARGKISTGMWSETQAKNNRW